MAEPLNPRIAQGELHRHDETLRALTGVVDEPGLAPTSLRDLLRTFRRHIFLIVVATSLGLGLGALFAFYLPAQYRASAVIRLNDARRAMTGTLATSPMEGLTGATIDRVMSQVEVLTSRSVALAVVDSLHELRIRTKDLPRALLTDLATRNADRADTLDLRFGIHGYEVLGRAGAQGLRPYGTPVTIDSLRFAVARKPDGDKGRLILLSRDEGVRIVLANLKAKPRVGTDVIDVDYLDFNPELARRVVNLVVQVFQAQNALAAQQESVRRRAFLESQVAHNDSLLDQARGALSRFRGRQRAFSTKQKLTTEQAGLSGLEVRREELDADRRMFGQMLSQLERGEGARNEEFGAVLSAPGMAQNPVIIDLFTQLNRFQGTRDSLTTGAFGSTDANPDVQRINVLIRNTEEKLVGAVRSMLASLDARIASLDEMRQRTSTAFPALSDAEEDESKLEQDVEAARGIVTQLRSEYEKARLAEAVEVGEVGILDLAVLPTRPEGVGPVRKLILGFLVGLVFGLGGAVLLEHLNTSIRRRDQIRSVLRLPELAVIPRFSRSTALRVRAGKLQSGPGQIRGSRGLPTTARPDPLVAHDPHSLGAEAYRLLRTNLTFASSTGSPRTVVVTSAAPGDGKTTVASNLAATFAQQGMQVLLIDCDLRRGRLHTLFRIPREPGLTQVLAGHTTLAQAVRPSSVEGLSVLPMGSAPSNPGELMGSAPMREVLEAASQQYELVILDTPPVLAAADTAVLASFVDATLLVVRAGRTSETEALTTMSQLLAVNARVVGAVLNDQDSKMGGESVHYYAEYYSAHK